MSIKNLIYRKGGSSPRNNTRLLLKNESYDYSGANPNEVKIEHPVDPPEEVEVDTDDAITNVDANITENPDYFKSASRKDVMTKYGSFVDTILEGTGILPSTLFTQLFVESDIRRDGSQNRVSSGIAKGYNPFNIKQYAKSDIEDFYLHTDDAPDERFVKYDSFENGLIGYRDFLLRNPRYSNALGTTNAKEQLQLIAKAGFATSPTYEKTLMAVLTGDVLTGKYGGLIYKR